MDLFGTDLVVLSACETGVGEVQVGEGVFGLRRAFALAGAESLLMSLWPVQDAVTADQMTLFYKYLQARTSDEALIAGEALRKAQLATIKELRKSRGHAPPSLWAPFILQGGYALGKPNRSSSALSQAERFLKDLLRLAKKVFDQALSYLTTLFNRFLDFVNDYFHRLQGGGGASMEEKGQTIRRQMNSVSRPMVYGLPSFHQSPARSMVGILNTRTRSFARSFQALAILKEVDNEMRQL